MALCLSGLDLSVSGGEQSIFVSPHHPLVKLSNAIPWEELSKDVAWDLRITTKMGYWHIGRKLKLRIHLGIYFLQHMFNMTYRQVEREVRDNAAYQAFCGRGIVDGWHIPDHSRIFEFQQRIRPATQQDLANAIAKLAYRYGFADPSWMDIDSTIQKANIRRTSEIYLLERLGSYAFRLKRELWKYIPEKYTPLLGAPLDTMKIRCLAKYYFLYGNSCEKTKAKVLEAIKNEILPIMLCMRAFISLLYGKSITIPNRLARYLRLIDLNFINLLENVNYFIGNGVGQKGRLLSLHIQEIAIFAKGQVGRLKVTFGRQWQVGRIGGNFLIVGESKGARSGDHESLGPMIKLHRHLFGYDTLRSFGTDKGYYSEANLATLEDLQKNMKKMDLDFNFSLPKRGVRDYELSEQAQALMNRRSGVEALISQAKAKGQLRRTRANTDVGMKKSGYTSILGFNLRQMTRHLMQQR